MRGYLVAGKTGSINRDDDVIVLRLHFWTKGAFQHALRQFVTLAP
jgi:hypothetical protein